MYQYQSYKLSYTCTQIELIRDLFAPDRLQSTQAHWAKSLCKLVRKNERALFREIKPHLLVAIDDTETLAEFDRLESIYPHLVKKEVVEFKQRQESDEIATW